MHKPRGLGWFGAFMVIDCFIVIKYIIADNIADINTFQVILLIIVPCVLSFPCYLLGEKIFLKVTKGNTEKSRKYADYTDDIVFIITIVMIAIFYNIGML